MGGGVALLFSIMSTPKQQYQSRFGQLLGFGLLQGLSLGPLIQHAVDVDPSLVFTAFCATTVVFVAFSLTALYAQRRSWLFLGGMLSSALGLMLMMSLMNIFFRSYAVW